MSISGTRCVNTPSLETIFDPAVINDRPEPLSKLLKNQSIVLTGDKLPEVINISNEDDLKVLQGLTQLYFEGLIYETRSSTRR